MTQDPKGCVFVSEAEIAKTLETSPTQGKRSLQPFKDFAAANKLPFIILEDHNVTNDFEVHREEADLWLCLEGEVTFTYGGELIDGKPKDLGAGRVDEREWKSEEAKGTLTQILSPGDWLYIPPGAPHKHDCPNGTARLLIIKIPKA